MSFKIKSPYNIDNTPIYFVKEEDGVLGRTNMNCSITICLLYTSPSPRDRQKSRMPSSA